MAPHVTREIAQKVRDTVDAGLVNGVGEQKPGLMCVEAAVCYALGCPRPGCRFVASARSEGRVTRAICAHLVKAHMAKVEGA